MTTSIMIGPTIAAIAVLLIPSILILFGGWIVIKLCLKVLAKALTKTTLDAAIHKFILRIASIALWLILLVTLLGFWKVPTAPIITVFGACGAAVALALKNSLSNVAGGIFLLLNKPFLKGELVEIGGNQGYVEEIDLLMTTLITDANDVILIPNGVITTGIVINHSREKMKDTDDLGTPNEKSAEKADERAEETYAI